MARRIIQNLMFVFVFTATSLGYSVSESFGGGSTSVDNGIVRVTLEWSEIGNPFPNIDFTVDFSQSLNPAIELKTGDLGWIVSSELVSNSNPANIGSLTTPDAENYAVDIAKAQDAGSLTFQPAGDHFSSLRNCDKIIYPKLITDERQYIG